MDRSPPYPARFASVRHYRKQNHSRRNPRMYTRVRFCQYKKPFPALRKRCHGCSRQSEYASRCRNAKEIEIRVQKENTDIQFRIPENCVPWVFRGYSVGIPVSIPGKKKTEPSWRRRQKPSHHVLCLCCVERRTKDENTAASTTGLASAVHQTNGCGRVGRKTDKHTADKRDDDDERENRRDVQERANSGRG